MPGDIADALTEIAFVVEGGPHRGATENPVCYARTTQRAKHVRWEKRKLSKRTGQLLPRRLTHWARYQDYIDHVRRALDDEQCRTLFDEVWPALRTGERTFVADIIVQFSSGAHSDPDHVASTIADALFPKPPRNRPRPSSRPSAYRPVWSFDERAQSPGDKLVLPRMLDCRDGYLIAFVAVHIHGPYRRGDWYNHKFAAALHERCEQDRERAAGYELIDRRPR